MKVELFKATIGDVVKNFIDNDEEGVVGYDGKLNIRPKYQREFIYDETKRNLVIDTIFKGFPLNVMYWVRNSDGLYEVLDGQQRTISFCRYACGDFSVKINGNSKSFHNLNAEERDRFLNYELMIYVCEGNESEKLDWFRIVNIAGERLRPQELLNAVYTGTWLSDAKKFFSKRDCVAYKLAHDYINSQSHPVDRQGFLEVALKWISQKNNCGISDYMALHQHDPNANELWFYFKNVIDWVSVTFPKVRSDMKSIEWARLYETYHNNMYDSKVLEEQISNLRGDVYVHDKSGVYEFVLGNCEDYKLLSIRLFNDDVKISVYETQTKIAKEKGISNCPLCAKGNNSNKTRIWEYEEMDADHVTAWSKGGKTDISNCEMLCSTHNKSKGNK